MEHKVCHSCQLAALDEKIPHSSEICTTQVASRPCANGFRGKWVKKCRTNKEQHREARHHPEEVGSHLSIIQSHTTYLVG